MLIDVDKIKLMLLHFRDLQSPLNCSCIQLFIIREKSFDPDFIGKIVIHRFYLFMN